MYVHTQEPLFFFSFLHFKYSHIYVRICTIYVYIFSSLFCILCGPGGHEGKCRESSAREQHGAGATKTVMMDDGLWIMGYDDGVGEHK